MVLSRLRRPHDVVARTRPWLLVVALLVVAMGCSNGSEGLAPLPDGDAAAPDDLALFDEDGDLLTLSVAMERPSTWHPLLVSPDDEGSVLLADLLYDGLTEAVGGESTLRPGLATSWSASADVTEWRFELDAERIDAVSVVSSFDEVLRSGSSSLAATLLSHVETVRTDGSAVVFELRRPDAGLPWLLSGVAYSVVGAQAEPTGRYDVEEIDGGLVLTARDGLASTVGTVEVAFVEDGVPAELLAEGGADVAVVGDDALDAGVVSDAGGPTPSVVSSFWVLNVRSETMQASWLRRAVVDAVDRSLSVELVGGSGAIEIDGVSGSTVAGSAAGACGDRCDGDAAAAAAAVAEVGEQVEIVVGFVSDEQRAAVEQVVADLVAVGFEARASQLTALELAAALETGEVDLTLAGWVAPANSLDAVVRPLMGQGSATNLVGGSTPEVEELLAQADVELHDVARWELLMAAQAQMLAESTILPLVVNPSHVVRSQDASYVEIRADGSIDLE